MTEKPPAKKVTLPPRHSGYRASGASKPPAPIRSGRLPKPPAGKGGGSTARG
ncbi:hypothetical protein NODU109028_08095 [Nocardioides dubius]